MNLWHIAERALFFGRLQELRADPSLIERTFDTAHWKAIHHHLLQDMYEWAGEFRTVNMRHGDHGFADQKSLEVLAEGFLAELRQVDMFAGQDKRHVVAGLAVTLQRVNAIHPFREGNGRTQRILAEHIAERAGYVLDWDRIGTEEQNEIMARSFDGDLEPLLEALDRAVLPNFRGGSVEESPWPAAPASQERAPDFWRFTKPLAQVIGEARTTNANAEHHAPPATREVIADQELGR
jgi:cell filamentation protein